MTAMRTLETLVLHGSAWLEGFEASGVQDDVPPAVSLAALDCRFARAPRDLRALPQPGGRLLLSRRRPAGEALLERVVDGDATPADLEPPEEPLYRLQGELADGSGRYLARRFDLQVGNGVGARLRLFRTPAATAFPRAGGLFGRLEEPDGTPVPYARLALRVRPAAAEPLDYAAMTDAAGEFRLALPRLPEAARARRHAAELRVFAVRASAEEPHPPDPDVQLNPTSSPSRALLVGEDPGNPAHWGGQPFAFSVEAGRVAVLASPNRRALVLRLP
jgi:hypothetical protein